MKILHHLQKSGVWILLFSITLLAACQDHDVDISVTDSPEEFNLKAKYDPGNTNKVYSYLNRSLDTQLFSNEDKRVDGNIRLDDQTDLFVKASEGSLTIRMDKDKNSHASYRRMKEIYSDLGEIMSK